MKKHEYQKELEHFSFHLPTEYRIKKEDIERLCASCEHFKYNSKCEMFNFANVNKNDYCSRWRAE